MILVYKCRACGATVKQNAPDITNMHEMAIFAMMESVAAHECGPGKLGVTDLTGGEE